MDDGDQTGILTFAWHFTGWTISLVSRLWNQWLALKYFETWGNDNWVLWTNFWNSLPPLLPRSPLLSPGSHTLASPNSQQSCLGITHQGTIPASLFCFPLVHLIQSGKRETFTYCSCTCQAFLLDILYTVYWKYKQNWLFLNDWVLL